MPMISRSLRDDLEETVRLYFAPVTAVVREFRRAIGRRGASDLDDRAASLRQRERALARRMRRLEQAIAEQRRGLERSSR
jgi:hypothetical protein